MSRFRLYPSPAQEVILLRYCADARFVWNLGQEQRSAYRPGRGRTPGFTEQCRQLTEARAAEPWLAEGSQNVHQQALRDLDQAWKNFFNGTHGRPTWRKANRNEGFRITEFTFDRHVQRLNRHWGQVKVPKIGWVRFRWSRAVPEAKSYRVTRDRAGRWHVAFAVIPQPIPGPGTGEVVGVDRGVTVSAALSTGELLHCPGLSAERKHRLVLLQRRMARRKRGSNRRNRLRPEIAELKAIESNVRKNWCEQVSTDLARRFD